MRRQEGHVPSRQEHKAHQEGLHSRILTKCQTLGLGHFLSHCFMTMGSLGSLLGWCPSSSTREPLFCPQANKSTPTTFSVQSLEPKVPSKCHNLAPSTLNLTSENELCYFSVNFIYPLCPKFQDSHFFLHHTWDRGMTWGHGDEVLCRVLSRVSPTTGFSSLSPPLR